MNNHIEKGKLNIENEVISLKAIIDIIDSILNYEVIKIEGSYQASTITCESNTHQKFFNIILVDFLSCTSNKSPIAISHPYLKLLRMIVQSPNFLKNGSSIISLSNSIDEFKKWLDAEIKYSNINITSINEPIAITFKRMNFLKICGNISKHNFLRLDMVSDELKMFIDAGIILESDHFYLILQDFYIYFFTNIFNYHLGTIAEFLNGIRWGIQEYLEPELCRYMEQKGNAKCYIRSLPEGINRGFAKECYWNLMEQVNKGPIIPRFKVTEWLKKRY